jgi:hypothetical protein
MTATFESTTPLCSVMSLRAPVQAPPLLPSPRHLASPALRRSRKPGRRPPVQVPAVSLTAIQKREEERSNRAKAADLARQNATVIQPSDPRVAKWMKHPGSMDIQGVDTKLSDEERLKLRAAFHARIEALKAAKRAPRLSSGQPRTRIHKESVPHLVPPHRTRRGVGITRRSDR